MLCETPTISTDKSLSENYVPHNSVDKGGKVNPFLVRLKICAITGNTADFHGDGYLQQECWNFKRLTNCFQRLCKTLFRVSVMLTLNTAVFKLNL